MKSINRAEFVSRQRLFLRASNIWNGLFLLVVLGMLFSHNYLARRFGLYAWASAYPRAYLMVFFSFVLVGVYLMNRGLTKRYSMLCPVCGTTFDLRKQQIVVATSNCPGCGSRVIHDVA